MTVDESLHWCRLHDWAAIGLKNVFHDWLEAGESVQGFSLRWYHPMLLHPSCYPARITRCLEAPRAWARWCRGIAWEKGLGGRCRALLIVSDCTRLEHSALYRQSFCTHLVDRDGTRACPTSRRWVLSHASSSVVGVRPNWEWWGAFAFECRSRESLLSGLCSCNPGLDRRMRCWKEKACAGGWVCGLRWSDGVAIIKSLHCHL